MLKKIIGLFFTMSLVIGQGGLVDFFKYSTAYGSFSLNAPRHQDDRFAIVGGLSTGILEVKRTERAKGGRAALKRGGGKFPDYSGDGKITMKDILMGRGVIKKKNKKKMMAKKFKSPMEKSIKGTKA